MFKRFHSNRCYLIAEIGGNFKDWSTAKRLVDDAAAAGVDAVKLQTYRADTLSTRAALFDMENTGVTSQYDLFKEYEISEDLHRQVFDYAEECGLDWLSTPSHSADVDMLERLGADVYKIGSDDAVNIPFLKYVAKKRKPIFLATGMCTLAEVRESVRAIQQAGNRRLVLMHAITCYPTHAQDVNLSAITTLMRAFPNLPVGYSDHTIGTTAAIAAAALGARVIEKHFTYDKKAQGPDHQLSADPAEMADLVRRVRELEVMRGDGVKRPAAGEKTTRLNNRKSIVVGKPIKQGEKLTRENISIKRPGRGLAPKYFEKVLGKRARRDLAKDALLAPSDFR